MEGGATATSTRRWDQRLFAVLWIWVAFRTIVPWLVFFRLTLEGSSYRWGTQYFGRSFHSSGLARPDFLLIYGLLAISLYLLWLLRRHDLRFGRPLLLLYLGVFAADALHQLLRGERMIFQGDTLGVKVDLTLPFVVLNVGMLAVALAWWLGSRDVGLGAGPRPLTPVRRAVVKACVAFLPIQVALLVFGEPHALTDEIGVIGTILQWCLLAWALYPGSDYRRTA